MAKFRGIVGYADEHEVSPGVWDGVRERTYSGDVVEDRQRITVGQQINGEISLKHQISIVSDAYANDHVFAIRYVKWRGGCWAVTDAVVQRPRIILTLGGMYNGEQA